MLGWRHSGLSAHNQVRVGKEDAEGRNASLRLSGREHEVLAAIALKYLERMETMLSATTVRFRKLEPAEIDAYITSGDPLDKAGAYGIQSQAALFIEEIRGSYSGVVAYRCMKPDCC